MSDRILIFGNSGAGQSILAQTLARDHTLAHLDLDHLAWVEIEKFTSANASWVIEGARADLLTMLLDECSELVFLNPGVEAYESRDEECSLSSHRWLFDRFNGVKREFTALS